MKEKIEDIYADIESQYGKSLMDRNIAFILSLIEARIKDGVLDDKIPVPSTEATAKAIILLLNRPELPWKEICKERRVLNVMEYLFIRAQNHYDEVRGLVVQLLGKHVKSLTPNMVKSFLNAWDFMVRQSRPSRFAEEILYPEYTDRILDALRSMLNGEVGRGAALVMVCAQKEGLVREIAHAKVVTEFPHITKTAYNNYIYHPFPLQEITRTVGTLRTKIGYTRSDDGVITFRDAVPTRRGIFLRLWRFLRSFSD